MNDIIPEVLEDLAGGGSGRAIEIEKPVNKKEN
jgi:hypothetical protein